MQAADAIMKRIQAGSGRQMAPQDLQELADEAQTTIHLAVMNEPYLAKVRSGEKYIESRLTKVNIAPFERAASGDVILFKRSGGAILAMAEVDRVQFEVFTAANRPADLAATYQDGLGYEPGYVEAKRDAKFASLLWLSDVHELPATPLSKRGRQAWVTYAPQFVSSAGRVADQALF